MKRSLECRLLDQKIINEQLPPHIDWDHRGGRTKVWRNCRLLFDRRWIIGKPRRPFARKYYAVVKHLGGTSRFKALTEERKDGQNPQRDRNRWACHTHGRQQISTQVPSLRFIVLFQASVRIFLNSSFGF